MSVDYTFDRTIPGVVIQAHVLAQLLDGRKVPNAEQGLTYAVVAFMALLGVVIGLSRLIFVYKGVAAVLAVGGYIGLVIYLANAEVLFLPVSPALSALFIALYSRFRSTRC